MGRSDVNFCIMLHALLHGKLDETVPEPHLREDALTSAVFGTLVWLNAWDVLAHWLGVPNDPSAGNGEQIARECWFWPRMAFAEPDVVLRIGNTLVVVEAKYRSDRHDLVAVDEGDEDRCDQIFRQYRCVMEPLSQRARYSEPIERAVRECRLVQVFVVDARRQRRARREWVESKERLPAEASLKLVTWQSLFRRLNGEDIAAQRWSIDLRAYLQICGLDTFDGISRQLESTTDVQEILTWRSGADAAESHIRIAVQLELSQAAALQDWRAPGNRERESLFNSFDHEILDGSAQTAIFAWRVPKLQLPSQN